MTPDQEVNEEKDDDVAITVPRDEFHHRLSVSLSLFLVCSMKIWCAPVDVDKEMFVLSLVSFSFPLKKSSDWVTNDFRFLPFSITMNFFPSELSNPLSH